MQRNLPVLVVVALLPQAALVAVVFGMMIAPWLDTLH